ncbi:MAG: hypothetical protein IJF16_10560, partial [Clostridia bacterium]|nr:hypothetical protein [Clostridia bacterium]
LQHPNELKIVGVAEPRKDPWKDCAFGAAICAFGARYSLRLRYAAAPRDMCARGLYFFIKLTGSSAVKNFANRESAHTKYFDLV